MITMLCFDWLKETSHRSGISIVDLHEIQRPRRRTYKNIYVMYVCHPIRFYKATVCDLMHMIFYKNIVVREETHQFENKLTFSSSFDLGFFPTVNIHHKILHI